MIAHRRGRVIMNNPGCRKTVRHLPGGIEELFAEQTAYFAQLQGPPDPAELAAIGARHRARAVGPSISTDAQAAANRS